MNFGTTLQLVGAASPFVMIVIAALLKRKLDQAQAEKTMAETRVQEATVTKTRQEAAGLVVDHAAKLIAEFREYQNEKDLLAAERLGAAEAHGKLIEARMSRMEEAFSRLRAVLATHGVWDAAALIDLRRHIDEYPPPPPLPQSIDDEHYKGL